LPCAPPVSPSPQIELIDGRWHNIASAPAFVCRLNGLAMGSLMHLLEPLWSRTLWLVGDDSCAAPAAAAHAQQD
jgi:hypothetical protein